MYFWKTNLLVEELAKGPLEENILKNYYLATSILLSIAFYLASITPPENLYLLTVETIGVLIVTIVGLNAAFAANGGNSGTRFLEKIVAISFPLLIRMTAAAIALGLLWVFFCVALEVRIFHKLQLEWVSSILFEWGTSILIIVIQVVFYQRLVTHVKNTNA